MPDPIATQEYRAKEKAAENFLKMQFVSVLEKTDLTEKRITAIVKLGLLARVSDSLFNLYESGKNPKTLNEMDLKKGCGGDIKWLLIKSYSKEYKGCQYPKIYAERYCTKETSYQSSAIQEKFIILNKIGFVKFVTSEHIDCEDITIEATLIELINSYYSIKAFGYT